MKFLKPLNTTGNSGASIARTGILNRGLTIALKDLRDDFEETFRYDGGLQAFVEYMDEGRSALHEPVHFGGERDGVVTRSRTSVQRFLPAKYFELRQQYPHTRRGHTTKPDSEQHLREH